ncbi:hypothetical protein D3C78_614340 [compost metagenome]
MALATAARRWISWAAWCTGTMIAAPAAAAAAATTPIAAAAVPAAAANAPIPAAPDPPAADAEPPIERSPVPIFPTPAEAAAIARRMASVSGLIFVVVCLASSPTSSTVCTTRLALDTNRPFASRILPALSM